MAWRKLELEYKYNCIKNKDKDKDKDIKNVMHVLIQKKKISCVYLYIYMCIFWCTHTEAAIQHFYLKTPKRFRKLSIAFCCSYFTEGEVKVQRGYMCEAHCCLECNNQQTSSQLAEELPLPPSANHLLLSNEELAILVQALHLPIPAASLHSTWRNHGKPQRSFDMFKQSSPFFKKQA